MLALLPAHITNLRLQTGILVLPYRNPFIVARDITTLDAFSGGRVTLSVGAGYLKGEYHALGVDFEKRNELMDEYLRAIRAATTGEEFAFDGTGYQAFGNRIVPARHSVRDCRSTSAATPSAGSAGRSNLRTAGTRSSPRAMRTARPRALRR